MENTKTKTATLALVIVLITAAMVATLPIISAHEPPWDIPTYAYLTAVPDPVGVDQTVTLVFWLDKFPPTAGGTTGDRWRNLTIEITKPDGSEETLGPFNSDPVGSGYTLYTPTQVGTYTFVFNFPGQVLSLIGPDGTVGLYSDYINDTYLESSATATLTVQQEPIPTPASTPLPTEYWTRPIEGQNTEWYRISSNWLSAPQIVGKVQPDGTAPNSPHIMWTKPLEFGGVIGGTKTGINGMTVYDGSQYENKFTNPVIMYGRLYYSLPISDASPGGGYICVDLLTGEEIWVQNYSPLPDPSFGQFFDYESLNQHGIIPNGYLWASIGGGAFFGPPAPATMIAVDPLTGQWLFNETNVPPGVMGFFGTGPGTVYGPNGEIMSYILDVNNNWLALWSNTAHGVGLEAATDNSTNGYQWRPIGKNVDMGTAYLWNITIPTLPAGSSILKVIPDDLILGNSPLVSFTGFGTPETYTVWAISLKPETRGQLLWSKEYLAPPGNITRSFGPVCLEGRVFTTWDKETISWSGYSIDDGSLLWTTESENPWNIYSGAGGALTTNTMAYGRLYSTGYSGICYCYDCSDGTLLWKYEAPGGLATPYGGYPLGIAGVADGKIYFNVNEHSSGAPYWKGAELHCVNATTGDKIWSIYTHGASSYGSFGYAIADGCLVFLNVYDMQVYCIGKGPSKTTVDAPLTAVALGSSVTIRGRVTDEAAGTKQDEQAARFPNGVPAMSDEDQSAWMEYVYMQKLKPEDAQGVKVKLYAIDPNGNYQDIGEVTTDIQGNFGTSWEAPVPGEYYVVAEFEGTESYWGSSDSTYFTVDLAPSPAASMEPEQPATATASPAEPMPSTPEPTPGPTGTELTAPEPTAAAPTDASFITTETAILAAVAVACIIGTVAFVALKRK